ncbi:DUF4105 domain-containing protein [Camelimonas abortus]|uniref:DUF4105 domain-containing protein n=1 Tax=Camelimonas abortus TaxID=1017184 RepID=A0ABV7LD76_9HYPH
MIIRLLGDFLVCLVTLAFLALGSMALAYQLPAPMAVAAVAVLAAATAGALWLWFRRRRLAASVAWLVVFAVMATWWESIEPSLDRDWAPDVARGVVADIDGDDITLMNVRNFRWRDGHEGAARWEKHHYRFSDLASLDVFTSVWDSPAIAHTLVSFGFRDGRHLVFSAEIRREVGEEFSSVGGFFKQFEMVLVAATEEDIIRLRTNFRKEDVSLFPVDANDRFRRELLRSYLEYANRLAATPVWYQTIRTNCTTVAYRLAAALVPGAALDWRILFSGYLPDYLYDHGYITTRLPLEEVKKRARITAIAQGVPEGADFSAAIRSGPVATLQPKASAPPSPGPAQARNGGAGGEAGDGR